jgi:hypothetical protein
MMFDLPNDDASVDRAFGDNTATMSDLGTPMTASERAAFKFSQDAGRRVSDVAAKAEAALPISFGGAWFDYRAHGKIYASFTGDHCPDPAFLESLNGMSTVPVVAVQAAHGASKQRLDDLELNS